MSTHKPLCTFTVSGTCTCGANLPLPSIEATCAVCGDQCVVPGDEDPEDTLCVACAEDRDDGTVYGDELDLNREGDPAFNGAFDRW